MAKEPMDNPPVIPERLPLQIDEINKKLSLIENLITDLSPSVEKISEELHPALQDLKKRIEKDETFPLLIKKVGDNIPTFLTLLDTMEAVKGMVEDFAPSIGKISKEIMPTINMLRETFERDEVLELIQKTGENINTFNKLMDFLNKFDKSGIFDFTMENVLAKETNLMLKGMQKCAIRTMQHF